MYEAYSKKIKSIINGIRHITPIPIISIPKFLATIFKSVLDIYLINYNIKWKIYKCFRFMFKIEFNIFIFVKKKFLN